MQYEDNNDDARRTRHSVIGLCVLQIAGDELVSAFASCEPWREWRDVELHPTMESALAVSGPGSVIVEVEGHGNVRRDNCVLIAQLGHPRGMWGVCGDDATEAMDVCAAYGLSWNGIACSELLKGEEQTHALWAFDRDFRRSFATTRWTMPRINPTILALMSVALIVLIMTTIAWMMVSAGPKPTQTASTAPETTQDVMRAAAYGPPAPQAADTQTQGPEAAPQATLP